MKVNIGPYKYWYGNHQFVDSVFWFLSESKRDEIVKWVPQYPFEVLNKLFGDREISIRIDDFDTWNMDHTLALIIVPMLKQLKETKHGAPYVDDQDVPDSLKSTNALPKENDYDIDSNHFARWDYVIDEMVWAFEQKINNSAEQQFYTKPDGEWSMKNPGSWDMEGLNKHNERMANGFLLFGKYYNGLWD